MLQSLPNLSSRWIRTCHSEPVLLRTDRLILREFDQADVDSVFAYRSDQSVLRFLADTKPLNRDVVEALVSVFGWHPRYLPRFEWHLAVVLADSTQLIGELGLCRGWSRREAYLGFIFNREFWGQGYATEAARELLRFAFQELGLRRVLAGCHPENGASWRVIQKLGMQSLGQVDRFPGSPRGIRSLAAALTREEWERQISARQSTGAPVASHGAESHPTV